MYHAAGDVSMTTFRSNVARSTNQRLLPQLVGMAGVILLRGGSFIGDHQGNLPERGGLVVGEINGTRKIRKQTLEKRLAIC